MVPDAQEDMVIYTEVLTDCLENVSDHLPILIKTRIEIDMSNDVTQMFKTRITWNKMTEEDIKERYTDPLDEKCHEILVKCHVDPMFVINLPEFFALEYETLEDILPLDLINVIKAEGGLTYENLR